MDPTLQPTKVHDHNIGSHLHVGGLILLIIIAFILLKVDLKEGFTSGRFDKNIAFIQKAGDKFFASYLAGPIMYVWDSTFSQEIKNGITFLESQNTATQTGRGK